MADNPDLWASLTARELAAIRALERLAAKWPGTLTLLSYDGALSVVRTSDRAAIVDGFGPDRQDLILTNIDGIPNDGGGW